MQKIPRRTQQQGFLRGGGAPHLDSSLRNGHSVAEPIAAWPPFGSFTWQRGCRCMWMAAATSLLQYAMGIATCHRIWLSPVVKSHGRGGANATTQMLIFSGEQRFKAIQFVSIKSKACVLIGACKRNYDQQLGPTRELGPTQTIKDRLIAASWGVR